jgi:uroporphyrinogen-III synthase
VRKCPLRTLRSMTSTIPATSMLAGYTVAMTDLRQRQVSARLRQHGATVTELPLLRIVPAEKDARLRSATRFCIAGPLDYAIATSAPGWLRWLKAADVWGLKPMLLDALSTTAIVSAGTATDVAVRHSGLRDTWSPPSGGFAEAIAWLMRRDLVDRRVAVASDDLPAARLLTAVRACGAQVISVPTLRWAPPAGLAPLHSLVRMVIRREVHAVTFTSASAAGALVDTAGRLGRRESLLGAFATDVVAAGATASAVHSLIDRSIPALRADNGGQEEFATLITDELLRRRRTFTSRDTHFIMQGNLVLVDGLTMRLPSGSAAIMRALTDKPGATLSRTTLGQLAPLPRGARTNGVDLAVSQLRATLGEYEWLVVTVPRQGYRLAVDNRW